MNYLSTFTLNTAGRDIAVGDIHGHFSKLQRALDAIGFDPAKDRLFSVGDMVDRGPESAAALQWLDKPWFHAVRGNHEDMAIRWARPDNEMSAGLYAQNGGAWNIGNTQAERVQFADAFDVLPLAIEVETQHGLVGIVHADCPFADWNSLRSMLCTFDDLPKKSSRALGNAIMWSRDRIEAGATDQVAGVTAVIVGHTPVERCTSLGNVIYIDTGAWLPEHRGPRDFTLLDLATLRPAQAPGPLSWGDAA